MMTSSNGNIFRVTGPLCGEFTSHQWIPRTSGQWSGSFVFSLICAWTNGWVNNQDVGDFDVGFLRNVINTLRPRQDGRHLPDDTYKWIFLHENVWISIKISLKFVPNGPISNIPALVQIMAWRRPGDKPLSEPMMVSLLTHSCVTRPQWVKT